MGKTAMVWGASGGIGKAVVDKLIQEGWQVIALGRGADELARKSVMAVEAEVGEPFSVQRAVSAAAQEVDEISLWVYAAGDIASQPVGTQAYDVWKKIMDANLNGAYLTTHISLPLLAKDCHLFYLGAVSERMRLPGLSAYAAAKSGLEALAEVVRKETRKKVTVLRPGAVDTAFWLKVPFKLPAHHLKPVDAAERLWRAYLDGEQGIIDF